MQVHLPGHGIIYCLKPFINLMSNKNLPVVSLIDVDPQRVDALIENEEQILGSLVQMRQEDRDALMSYSKIWDCNCYSCEFGNIFSLNWPPILNLGDLAGIATKRTFDVVALLSIAIARGSK